MSLRAGTAKRTVERKKAEAKENCLSAVLRFLGYAPLPLSESLKQAKRPVILRLPVVTEPRVGTTSKFLCNYGIVKLNYATITLNHVDQSKLNNVAVVVRRSIPDTHVITS